MNIHDNWEKTFLVVHFEMNLSDLILPDISHVHYARFHLYFLLFTVATIIGVDKEDVKKPQLRITPAHDLSTHLWISPIAIGGTMDIVRREASVSRGTVS